jgi:hypothetical protein
VQGTSPNLVPTVKSHPPFLGSMRPALLLAAVVALAGCTSSTSGPSFPPLPSLDRPEFEETTFELTVRDARVTAGRCFDGATEFNQECHVLRIHVANPNPRSVPLGAQWSAEDAEGGGADLGDLDGPASVAAGGQANATVRFTRPEGSPPLVRLVYGGTTLRAEATVPPYAPAA